MSVFQRRQASSTYALMRSFERRLTRLDEAIELVRAGRGDELERRQRRIGDRPDLFEALTADEDTDDTGERHEEFEEAVLTGVVTATLMDLQAERSRVAGLLDQARRLSEAGEDSKFEKLRGVLRNPDFAREKLIIFTEHRDTAEFLVHRLEGLGFTGQVAFIHGGLDYREREAQVELFRRTLADGGAQYLVATDAAGEGINLQFCWLMVNYDVPWNPARLEQRMGRIHRYGQKRDPVVIVNLTATDTREGRVLKVLLDKLEAIRRQLRSDKVFDVVGRLFQNVSLKSYLEMATTGDGERAAIDGIEGLLTETQMRALSERERALFGGGEVKSQLPALNAALEQEQYRRLLPGYVRRFVETAAPLIDLKAEGDLDGIFDLVPRRPRGLDPVLTGIEFYPAEMRGRFSITRPQDPAGAIWMHPGEPVFDYFCKALLSRRGSEARRGAIFIDPDAREPYLFHLAEVAVLRRHPAAEVSGLLPDGPLGADRVDPGVVETRLIGLRQEADGSIAPCPLEHLLLLRGTAGVAPGAVPLARLARGFAEAAEEWLRGDALTRMVEENRARIAHALPEQLDWIARGYDYKAAELIAARRQANGEAQRGDARAAAELVRIKKQQRRLAADKERRLASLRAEPSLIVPGEAVMLAHALVLPSEDPVERARHDAETETVAMQLARAHEEAAGATVHDVSRPDLARRAGLNDWPGFDLRSLRPACAHSPAEERAIEVKGRAGSGAVEVLENEWAKACNLCNRYWLYVVFDCATPQPRLIKVQDPFGRLLAKAKGSLLIGATEILAVASGS